MEESVASKRPREELEAQVVDNNKEVVEFEECSKRHKPYNHILSILESEEEESTQDLSPLITTLQQEIITCPPSNNNNPNQLGNDQDALISTNFTTNNNLDECYSSTSNTHHDALKENDEEEDGERVMRHLLQASDDELGIPNTVDGSLDFGEWRFNNNGDIDGDGDGFSSLCDKLWELEDEAANYDALLQSELFLWGQ